MNTCNFIGRVGTDLKIRRSKKSTLFVNFPLGISEYSKELDTNITEWIDCIAFGKTAEIITKTLQKGSKIGVTGKLHTSKYKRNDEFWVKKYILIVRAFYYCESKPTEGTADFSQISKAEMEQWSNRDYSQDYFGDSELDDIDDV